MKKVLCIFTANVLVSLAALCSSAHADEAHDRAMELASDLVRSRERVVPHVYSDPLGVQTWGVGQTAAGFGCSPDPATMSDPIPEEVVQQAFECSLKEARAAVLRAVHEPLSDNELAALTSFVFNVGETRFRNSCIVRHLNAGEHAAAADDFLLFIYGRDRRTGERRPLPGLVARRQDERDLFLSGVTSVPPVTAPDSAPTDPNTFASGLSNAPAQLVETR